MKVEVDLDANKISKKVNLHLGEAQKILDLTVIKDSNYYCPEDTGTLQDSAILKTVLGSGEIEWNESYARKLYYGDDFNFSKDENPNAQAKWFEAAKAVKLKDWVRIANAEYNS